MYLDPFSSDSLSPSTIWWKSKTSWARSDTKRRPAQSSPTRQKKVKICVYAKRGEGHTFFLEIVDLFEERGQMDDDAVSDQTRTGGVNETYIKRKTTIKKKDKKEE